MPIERRTLNAWHATLAVESLGAVDEAASTVLVLHSEEGPESIAPVVAGLAEHSHVVVPHHPGFGGEARVAGIDRPRDLAYLYLDLLDQLSVDACAVVGSSLGAWIALELAAMQPQRVRCLVAISPVGVKFGGPTESNFGELLVNSPDALTRMLYDDPENDYWGGRTEPDDVIRRMEQRESFTHYVWEPYLHEASLRQLLPRITAPVSILAGASDGLVAADYCAALADELPAAEVAVVDAAGHYPEIEQPARTAELVEQFVDKYSDQVHNLSGGDRQR